MTVTPVDTTGGGRGNLNSPASPSPAAPAPGTSLGTTPSVPGLQGLLNDLIPGLAPAEQLAGTVAAIGDTILNPAMWRSLGWLILGLATILLGMILWAKKPIETGIGTIAGAALKAP
jgi:hypothetical protein